jgi:hypothetical protein
MEALIIRLQERQRSDSIDKWTNCRKKRSGKNINDWMHTKPKVVARRLPHTRVLRPAPALIRRAKEYDERQKCHHARTSTAIKTEFEILADWWEQETRNISSPKMIANHFGLQAIVDLGEDVVPLILRRMSHRPWFWFNALMQLTKEAVDPITPDMRGDMQKMTDAWLRWGAGRGII